MAVIVAISVGFASSSQDAFNVILAVIGVSNENATSSFVVYQYLNTNPSLSGSVGASIKPFLSTLIGSIGEPPFVSKVTVTFPSELFGVQATTNNNKKTVTMSVVIFFILLPLL